jgi:hypothetical protein
MPEKSHSAYPCEVAGANSLAEPWYDSSSVEALGFTTARTRRPGQPLRATTSVLAEATYAVVVPRKSRGNRGLETVRSLTRASAVSPVIASRCEATRATHRCSVRACRER